MVFGCVDPFDLGCDAVEREGKFRGVFKPAARGPLARVALTTLAYVFVFATIARTLVCLLFCSPLPPPRE